MHSQPGAARPAQSAPTPPQGPRAALEALAVTLDPRHYAARLVTDDGPVPYLLVSSQHAKLSEAVFADDQSYHWPWGQPIAAIGNPKAAAAKVRYVLAAAPGHTHD